MKRSTCKSSCKGSSKNHPCTYIATTNCLMDSAYSRASKSNALSFSVSVFYSALALLENRYLDRVGIVAAKSKELILCLWP